MVSNISQLNQEGPHLVSSAPGLACLERIGKTHHPTEKMVQMAPRRTVSVLGLFAALASVQTATALTSDLSCPAETFVCLGDADCASCLEALQSGDINLATLFDECSEFYAGVCAVVESIGCDVTNTNLLEFAGCIAAEDFGCPDFVSCAAANSTATAAPTPAPMMTAAPTDMTVELTTLAPESTEDAREANEDSGVSRNVAAAATRTAVALACGLALFLSV